MRRGKENSTCANSKAIFSSSSLFVSISSKKKELCWSAKGGSKVGEAADLVHSVDLPVGEVARPLGVPGEGLGHDLLQAGAVLGVGGGRISSLEG